jgi:phage terminase large subunit
VDEDGIGGGVVDHLPGVRGFTANSVAIPTDAQIRERASRVGIVPSYRQNYANLKSQCGWKLAELINEHKMAIKVGEHREMIIAEVSAALKEKDADKENGLRLIPKEEVKEVLGSSPDIGDTLLMRAWFEIQPSAYRADPSSNEAQVRLFNRNAQANSTFDAA